MPVAAARAALLILLTAPPCGALRAWVAVPVAGSPRNAAGAADGAGSAATFSAPVGVAVNTSGDGTVFVADAGANVIRAISPAGAVRTLAGGGGGAAGAADGAASAARFSAPTGVAVLGRTLLVADANNNRIRTVSATGAVRTLAGSAAGAAGYADGVGGAAQFNAPSGVAADAAGGGASFVYVADTGNNCIRRVDVATGLVELVYGPQWPDGAVVCDNSAEAAGPPNYCLSYPAALLVTPAGALYVADTENGRVLLLGALGGAALPLAAPPAAVYGDAAAREYLDGLATAAHFIAPRALAVDARGRLYVADGAKLVRRVSPAGVVETFAGSARALPGSVDGAAPRFNTPAGLAFDAVGGALYFTDLSSNRVRALVDARAAAGARVRRVTTRPFAVGEDAHFARGPGLAVDASGVYVGDAHVGDASGERLRVRAFAPGFNVTSAPPALVSWADSASTATPPATLAVAVAANANVALTLSQARTLYVASPQAWTYDCEPTGEPDDTCPARKDTALTDSIVFKVPTAAAASLASAVSAVFDGSATHERWAINFGATFTAAAVSAGDDGATRVFYAAVVNAAEAATAPGAAGTYTCSKYGGLYANDAGSALPAAPLAGASDCSSPLASPAGLAFDAATGRLGALYVSDGAKNAVFAYDIDEAALTVLAGSGAAADAAGFDGVGLAAAFTVPRGLALDAVARVLYVAEYGGFRLRAIALGTRAVTTVAGSGVAVSVDGFGAAAGVGLLASLAVDADGDLIFADESESALRYVFDDPCPLGAYCPSPTAVLPCPAGTFGGALGLATPSCSGPCAGGFFCPQGSTSPTAAECPAGATCPPGAGAPTACAPGTFSPAAGRATPCAPCVVGTFEPAAGARTCTGACPAGGFGVAAGAVSAAAGCATCGFGTYSIVPGATTCTPCSSGFFGAALGGNSSAACALCPAGSFSPSLGVRTCAKCAAGKWSAAGAVLCDDCPAGSWSATVGLPATTPCVLCAPGTYNSLTAQSEAASCIACPPGSFAPSAGSKRCTPCPAGFYLDAQGSKSGRDCLPCRLGTYGVSPGQTSIGCANCLPGTASAVLNATTPETCAVCPRGTFAATIGGSKCTPCPPGTYGDRTGASACTECGQGTYSAALGLTDGSGCVSCGPQMTTAAPGATKSAECQATTLVCAIGRQTPSKAAVFRASECVALACPAPLWFSGATAANSAYCYGCKPGSAGAAGACATCAPLAICPGFTSVSLWNFSNAPYSVAAAAAISAAVPDDAGASGDATPAPAAADAARRAQAEAANVTSLNTTGVSAAPTSPWGACAPFRIDVPPSTASAAAAPFTSDPNFPFIMGGIVLTVISIGLPLLRAKSARLSEALEPFDMFSNRVDSDEISTAPVWRPAHKSTAIGLMFSLGSVSFIIVFAAILGWTYTYANVQQTTSLMRLETGLLQATIGIGYPFATAAVPGSGEALQGFSVRAIVAGEPGACSQPAIVTDTLGKWAYSAVPCDGAGVTAGAPAGALASVYQHTWACAQCELEDKFTLAFSFPFSCQSMQLEAAAVSALGEVAATSTGAIAASAEGGLLDSVTWTIQPLFSFQNDSTGTVYDSANIMGYKFDALTHVPKFRMPTLDATQHATLLPRSAGVDVVLDFTLQSYFVVNTLKSRQQVTDLFAQLFGLGSVIGGFGILNFLFRTFFPMRPRVVHVRTDENGELDAVDAHGVHYKKSRYELAHSHDKHGHEHEEWTAAAALERATHFVDEPGALRATPPHAAPHRGDRFFAAGGSAAAAHAASAHAASAHAASPHAASLARRAVFAATATPHGAALSLVTVAAGGGRRGARVAAEDDAIDAYVAGAPPSGVRRARPGFE